MWIEVKVSDRQNKSLFHLFLSDKTALITEGSSRKRIKLQRSLLLLQTPLIVEMSTRSLSHAMMSSIFTDWLRTMAEMGSIAALRKGGARGAPGIRHGRGTQVRKNMARRHLWVFSFTPIDIHILHEPCAVPKQKEGLLGANQLQLLINTSVLPLVSSQFHFDSPI